MKSVTRNKLLLCFKPVVDMDQLVLEPEGLRYVSIKKKQGMKRSMSTSSLPSRRRSSKSSSEHLLGLHNDDHSPRRTFSRVIKAVLFETVLSKRDRDRKALHQDSKHGSSASDRIKSLKSKEHNSVNKNSTLSCTCSSSEDVSKTLSKVDRNVTNPNQERKGVMEPKKTDSSSGMYLLLISLILTVICGKLCAILVTSTWLYLLTAIADGRKGGTTKKFTRKYGESHNGRVA